MIKPHMHATHPVLIARLKRADGHLRAVIGMVELGTPCLEIAQQMQAVEKAVANPRRALIHDHMDHGVTDGGDHDLTEIQSLTKLL